MKLIDIVYGKCGIIKAVIESDSNNEYSVSIDIDNNMTWCTCPRYIFKRETCKHILYLLDIMEVDKMIKEKFDNIPIDCMTIDSLMGNGFPQGTTTAIYAESGRGKTILSAQIALACIKNKGQDVIILETEGNRKQDYFELIRRFNQRWKVPEEDLESKIHFYSVLSGFESKTKSMIDLLNMVGYTAEIDQSKKGDKYTITFKDIKPKLKKKDLESSGVLIIDSLTEPIKATIGHKSQNLPARSELIARMFGRLISIANEYKISIVINHHATINPMQMFGRDFGKPYGGDEVLYNSKYILALIDSDMKARAKYGSTARRVLLMKHPYNSCVNELFPINLKKDWGYTDDE